MADTRSLIADDAFIWATGIEDTFITDPWPASGRILDEYELTEHYVRWREDIDLMASLGVRMSRYGIPWYRINPARNEWDWDWTDRVVDYLLERGVEPILDLVHYGVPQWIERAWLHPDLAKYMSEYAARVGERYRGRIRCYTPLNEPRITAWYCGRIGWWPPNVRGWKGFVSVMTGLCKGICMTGRALREIDPAVTLVHVDASDAYSTSDPALVEEARFRQDIGFLALDLVGGRVREGHPLLDWLLRHGARDADLHWFVAHAVPLDVVGLNMYPMFSNKIVTRGDAGLRIRMQYGGQPLVERLVDLYWQHFNRPMMITETAARGSVRRRQQWLHASLAAVRAARGRGVPLIGYTWWPMYALIAWAWRQGTASVEKHLQQMGLWDLAPSGGGLQRVETPLVEAYRALVRQGTGAVGVLERIVGEERQRVQELLPGRV